MRVLVDKSGWDRYYRRIRQAVPKAVVKVIDEAEDEIYSRTMDNLSGSVTGEMPIPRPTGTLAGAQKRHRLSDTARLIYTDPREANYGVHVHYGTRRMKPRPYMGAVVTERRQAVLNRLRYALKLALK